MVVQARDDHIRREWKMLAETVDRWLFWTFFLITTVSTLLFLVILPYRFSFLPHSMHMYYFMLLLCNCTSTMTKTKTKTAWFKKLSLDAISFNLRSVMLGLLSSLAFHLIIFQQTFFQPPREILLSLRRATSFYSSFGYRFKANTFPFFKNSDVIYFFMVRYLISSGCEK